MPPEHRPPVADRFVRAVEAGALDLPLPGSGQTGKRWAGLQALGEEDPVLARLGEGHADALAILAELGGTSPRHSPRTTRSWLAARTVGRVAYAHDLLVVTSSRRTARAAGGFSAFLTRLDAAAPSARSCRPAGNGRP